MRGDGEGLAGLLGDLGRATRPERRRTRQLRDAERRALDWLRHSGATDLADDFTGDELRRAFRTLAKRYHPDRHPGASALERARLAESFGQVTSAYRTLRAAVLAAD